jgi:hypothetical protein
MSEVPIEHHAAEHPPRTALRGKHSGVLASALQSSPLVRASNAMRVPIPSTLVSPSPQLHQRTCSSMRYACRCRPLFRHRLENFSQLSTSCARHGNVKGRGEGFSQTDDRGTHPGEGGN